MKVPQTNFFLFQTGIALLVLSHILYPYPKRPYRTHERLGFSMEFLNAFDIMDFVENISCVQTDDGWTVFYFLAVGISAIHLAFPVGLTGEEEEDPQWKKIINSAVTLIFTDISFTIIRAHAMAEEKTFEIGFNFLSKNIMATVYRTCLIINAMKQLYC